MIIRDNFGHSAQLKNSELAIPFNQRIKRGCKAFGIYFFAALLGILVPVLHFFLVPAFLFLAFYQGFTQFNQFYSIRLADEICPVCSKNLAQPKGYFTNRLLRTQCQSCGTKLVIED